MMGRDLHFVVCRETPDRDIIDNLDEDAWKECRVFPYGISRWNSVIKSGFFTADTLASTITELSEELSQLREDGTSTESEDVSTELKYRYLCEAIAVYAQLLCHCMFSAGVYVEYC